MRRRFYPGDYEAFGVMPGNPYADYGIDLCPVCGDYICIIGKTVDGRLIGNCQDAFTLDEWNDADDYEE